MSEVTITTLVSNYVTKLDFLAEKGMSLLIRYKDKNLLFNTGTGESLLVNGVRLGVDFSSIDAVFLSHGFRGATGGVSNLLTFRPKEIFAHPEVFERRFIRDEEDFLINVSARLEIENITQSQTKLTLNTKTTEIFPGVIFSGEIPYSSKSDLLEKRQVFKFESGGLIEVNLKEEQFLLLQTEKGWIVVCGGTQRGLLSLIEHASFITKEHKFYALVGKVDLPGDIDDQLRYAELITEYFDMVVPTCVYTPKHLAALLNTFGEKLKCLFIGETFEVY